MPEGNQSVVDSWTNLRTALGAYRVACGTPSFTDIEKLSVGCPGAAGRLPSSSAHNMTKPIDERIREWPRIDQFLKTCYRHKQRKAAQERGDAEALRSMAWTDPDDISIEETYKRWSALTDGTPMVVPVSTVPSPAPQGIPAGPVQAGDPQEPEGGAPGRRNPRLLRVSAVLLAAVLAAGGVWALTLDHNSSNDAKKGGASTTGPSSPGPDPSSPGPGPTSPIREAPTTSVPAALNHFSDCPANKLCLFPGADGLGQHASFQEQADDFRGSWASLFDHVYSAWNKSDKSWCLFTDSNIGVPPANWRGTVYRIPPGSPVDLAASVAATLESAEPCERLA